MRKLHLMVFIAWCVVQHPHTGSCEERQAIEFTHWAIKIHIHSYPTGPQSYHFDLRVEAMSLRVLRQMRPYNVHRAVERSQ